MHGVVIVVLDDLRSTVVSTRNLQITIKKSLHTLDSTPLPSTGEGGTISEGGTIIET